MCGLSFYLMGGKPPISWMGSKVGYSETLAAILGLSRTNVAGFVWGDAGPNVAALAHLCGATGATAEDVAGWVHANAVSMVKDGTASSYSHVNGEGYHFTRASDGTQGFWTATTPELNAERIDSLPLPATKAVANLIRSWKDEEPRALWERLKAKGWPSLLLPEGCAGRWLGPADIDTVASWVLTGAWCYKQGDHASGGPVLPGERRQDTSAVAVANLPSFPPIACWQGRAEDLVLPQRLDGWVIYMDGPYHGDGSRKITGYKHGGCSRESQLDLARGYHARGATVAVSESVRLDRELGDGWHAVDIGHARKGQARTFGNTEEWVTLNRPPAYYPPKQIGMFG